MRNNQFIIVKDRRPRIPDILNDCNTFCVQAKNGESLTAILSRMCNKITILESKVSQLQTDLDSLTARVVELEG